MFIAKQKQTHRYRKHSEKKVKRRGTLKDTDYYI